jgi:hypothetical protein
LQWQFTGMPKRGRALHHRDVHPGTGLETIESMRRRLHPSAGPSSSPRPPAPAKPSGSFGAGVPSSSTVAASPEPVRRPGSSKPPHSFRTWYVSRSLLIALGSGPLCTILGACRHTTPGRRIDVSIDLLFTIRGIRCTTLMYWAIPIYVTPRHRGGIPDVRGFNKLVHIVRLRPRPVTCVRGIAYDHGSAYVGDGSQSTWHDKELDPIW